MLTVTLCALALMPQGDYRKNINTFMDAERAFARMAAFAGMRDSFHHFFAPDGIAFNPEPHLAKEHFAKQEPEKKPLEYLLAWEPRIADSSGEGDLGYTTGPVKMIDLGPEKKPISHMSYFSIWKKQDSGELKVVFDLGTPMASEPVFPKQMKVRGAPSKALVAPGMVERVTDLIKRNEEDIHKSTAEELPKTLELLYNKEMTAYRTGAMPMLSEIEALGWYKTNKLAIKDWEVRKVDIAKSGDLAWCWGSYTADLNGKETRGYWAHVWKSEIGKGWHIVADVMSMLPPKAN